MEELGGLGRIEAFQKQSPEADAVFGVARIPRNERFKGSLRFLIAVLFPKRFGLSESWRRSLRREGGGRAQDGQQESLGRIEAFQKQSPEADAVFGVARIPRNERFKGSLRIAHCEV